MKKSIKIILITLAIVILTLFTTFMVLFISTSNVKLDKNKLIDLDKKITLYDSAYEKINEEVSDISTTEINQIPSHVKNAFISIEDKRFYSHKGIDTKGLLRATINNIKSFSFKEGASTISQQLIKNTHLTNKKTFNRKITEMRLARQLEKKYTKDEILEKYLNTIYFGDNCYGITSASRHYFSKEPKDLTVNEGAILAAIIKAPTNYSPTKNKDNCLKRKNLVLKEMLNQNYISNEQYEKNLKLSVETNLNNSTNYNVNSLVKKELGKIIEENNLYYKKLNIYTSVDQKLQNILENQLKNDTYSYDKSVLLTDCNSNIKAYFSTCNEISRPFGSTIKPYLCYAPAIEQNIVSSYSLINDEKTSFGEYTPSNYGEKYLGNISIKESLSKSSNVCAVKILNYVGVNNAINYLNKANIETTEKDKNLSIALGMTEKGATLSQIVSLYNVLSNNGNYQNPTIIEQITDENSVIIYKNTKQNKKIFSEETSSIVSDMLTDCCKNGTAKKLSFSGTDLCAKTGTVGTKQGNTDAYSISYNQNYTLGVWYGNKDNSLMPNTITGGTVPSITACNLWQEIYKDTLPPKAYNKSSKLQEIKIDKISYGDGIIELADINAPEKYSMTVLEKNNNVPKKQSFRFSCPKVENLNYSVENNRFSVSLCQTELFNFKIIREENGKKIEVFDSLNNKGLKQFHDKDVNVGKTYSYYLLPYYQGTNQTFFGKKQFLTKVKIEKFNEELDDWWQNEFSY